MIQVVAAVIRHQGKILICQRPQGKNLAGCWEFPGGKVEAGESKPSALARECREELAASIIVGAPIGSAVHDYGGYSVDITFYECLLDGRMPVAAEHSAIAWVAPSELESYNFCPADRQFIKALSSQ